MKEAFVKGKFHKASLEMIEKSNEVIAEYMGMDMVITLRQLYYQFVARGWIGNTQANYDKLGVAVTKGRMAGLIDWNAIEDRGRGVNSWLIQEDPVDVLNGIEYGLCMDMWEPQETYIEVWVEKDALSSVIERPCRSLSVPYMACRGYLSATALYDAGKRFAAAKERGFKCIMMHLGDHDPSGLDMTRDNADRLRMFARTNDIAVERLALNMEQVRKHNPPPNPAKSSDKRFAKYRDEFGTTSWELDALNPATLNKLITGSIEEHIDAELWEASEDKQELLRRDLAKLKGNWEQVRLFMKGKSAQHSALQEAASAIEGVLNHDSDLKIDTIEALESIKDDIEAKS